MEVMRDISARIQRYRLSRFGSPHTTVLRRWRWALPFLGLWLVYLLFLSEHSLLRIWLLRRDSARVEAEVAATRKELARLEGQVKDPAARRRQAEHLLRERSGWAKDGEIIYRIPTAEGDSLGR